jgi:DNA polymerase-3 subunit epsilon
VYRGTIGKVQQHEGKMRFERDRQDAIRFAKTKLAVKPLYLDTETTGLRDLDEIVEISILDHDGGVLFDSLVRPTCRIPADAIAIHGITDDMVRDAPRWIDIWPEVEAVLRGPILISVWFSSPTGSIKSQA